MTKEINENLMEHIKHHIGHNDVTGMEVWAVPTFYGNRRSIHLDQDEELTAAFTAKLMEAPYQDINAINEMLNQRTLMTGDTIISLKIYGQGEYKDDLIERLLYTVAAENGWYSTDNAMEAYAELSHLFGIGNMDPADFADELWNPYIWTNYSFPEAHPEYF